MIIMDVALHGKRIIVVDVAVMDVVLKWISQCGVYGSMADNAHRSIHNLQKSTPLGTCNYSLYA